MDEGRGMMMLPGGGGGGGEEAEDGAVNLALPLLGGLLAEIAEDAVVEDDVLGGARLDRIKSALAALHSGTEQIRADAHLPPCGLDEGPQGGEFFV